MSKTRIRRHWKSIPQIDELEKLLEEKEVEYRTAIDKEVSVTGARGATFHNYAIVPLPDFIVIGANGVIDSHASGGGLEKKIQELISD